MSAPAAKLIGVALAKRNKPSVDFCGYWQRNQGVADPDPYPPVRGDPRLRAVISPSDPTQDAHFADIFRRDLASRTLGLFREPLWLARVE